ncbi:MAG TPA: histidinol-phosphate transaminase [Terriglobales bacterium]|nr:histidinol-phosphate transaminase [Terriglobales bacterium]
MNRFDHLVPGHIRAMGEYVPGKSIRQAETESGVCCIKLASNENPFGPSPLALEAIRQACADVHLYPEADTGELRHVLAAHHGLKPEQVLVTAGSTSLLHILCRALLAPGLNAITSECSFIQYPIVTQAAGGRLIRAPMKNGGFDLQAILAAVDGNTRVIFIANPNNPTGSMLSPAEVHEFLEAVPRHVLTVLDEAYFDYANCFAAKRGVEYSCSLQYVRQAWQVMVLRTFSKAHGLAGARVGYGMASAELMHYFARIKTVFSVTALAQAAALAAMRDEAHIQRSLENNLQGEQWLRAAMTDLGLRVLPTWANFLYVDVEEDAAMFAHRLQAEGVIVRPLTGGWDCPHAVRITIGTPEQNQILMAAVKKVLAVGSGFTRP